MVDGEWWMVDGNMKFSKDGSGANTSRLRTASD